METATSAQTYLTTLQALTEGALVVLAQLQHEGPRRPNLTPRPYPFISPVSGHYSASTAPAREDDDER